MGRPSASIRSGSLPPFPRRAGRIGARIIPCPRPTNAPGCPRDHGPHGGTNPNGPSIAASSADGPCSKKRESDRLRCLSRFDRVLLSEPSNRMSRRPGNGRTMCGHTPYYHIMRTHSILSYYKDNINPSLSLERIPPFTGRQGTGGEKVLGKRKGPCGNIRKVLSIVFLPLIPKIRERLSSSSP